MKNINFVPKDVQRILSSDKISEKYNEQKVFFKKMFLIILQYSIENTCVGGTSFLIKMSLSTLSKRDSNAGIFLVILQSF